MEGDLKCKQIKCLNVLPEAIQKVSVPTAPPGDLWLRFVPWEHDSTARQRGVGGGGGDRSADTELQEESRQQRLLASLQVPHRQMESPSFTLNGSPATPLNRNAATELLWLCQRGVCYPHTPPGAARCIYTVATVLLPKQTRKWDVC